ncbi:hypothetical protein HRI_002975600 [Hibiscus trionum]|uniref:Fe2OG dioxygenase domain-containing protein n=1 Tax=Hibiscus trionum TaxID=183268 RepID=A0A9W7M9E2_HIBTR|nr:hypothetical protein HRI_002975600 [Hibiscus trionum]
MFFPQLQRLIRFDRCRLSTAASVSRQICRPICILKKMNPSQKPISSLSGYSSITVQKTFGNESSAEETLQSFGGKFIDEKQFQSNYELEGIVNVASLQEEHSFLCRSRTGVDSGLRSSLKTINSFEHEGIVDVGSLQEEHSFPSSFGKKKKKKKVYSNYVEKSPYSNSKSKNVVGTKNSNCFGGLPKVERFNICLPQFRDIESQEVLRPGMLLLKHYISLREQIDIVNTCNSLGEGPGGFYRPGYKDGAKLRLHMMCLGMNWDPQARKYDKVHPVDNCEPPEIPLGLCLLVQRAIKDAHCLIRKDSDMVNPEDILPSMSPNICIVNFYSIHGRLGLHQDRDESKESLKKGLPVVSLSIGDSAEFLYGNGREVDLAKKVLLESGDVLLFGGESRMVFHGVSSIVPSSAPEPLKAKTGLRQGRLNLTFRRF